MGISLKLFFMTIYVYVYVCRSTCNIVNILHASNIYITILCEVYTQNPNSPNHTAKTKS